MFVMKKSGSGIVRLGWIGERCTPQGIPAEALRGVVSCALPEEWLDVGHSIRAVLDRHSRNHGLPGYYTIDGEHSIPVEAVRAAAADGLRRLPPWQTFARAELLALIAWLDEPGVAERLRAESAT